MRVKQFSVLLYCLMMCSAAQAEKNNQALSQVQSEIKHLSGDLSRLNKKKGYAASELKKVEQEYGRLSSRLRDLNQQVTTKKRRIHSIDKDIAVQQSWLKSQEKQLSGQMRAAYALGYQERLKLFFNQQDPQRSSRILRYYHYFNKRRLAELTRIKASLQLLAQLKKTKQQEVRYVAGLMDDKKRQQAELAVTKKNRHKLLVKIKKDVRSHRAKLSKLKKEAQQLENLVIKLQRASEQAAAKKAVEKAAAIKKAQKSKKPVVLSENPAKYYSGKSFAQMKGKMSWPVQGKVLQKFGSKRVDSRWNGLLIGAPEGTNIYSVAHGQVVFADWFKGYGLLIIIKHDKNYMSLYAFNQSLYVSVGDWVKAGGLLATVGKSGGRDKAGLYFEVRKRNKAINPIRWLKKT